MKPYQWRSFVKPIRGTFLLAAAGLLLFASLERPAQALPPPGYTLTWSDEFNGAVGSSPNSANWNFDLGAGGWGNGELETYVSDAAHCSIISDPNATDGSALQITATDVGGVYESARLDSIGHQNPTFGYIEIRAKNPIGQGIWPAFWMLGTDFPTDSWPNCGEQDILEQFENAPGTNMSSWHMNYLGNEDDWTSPYTLLNGATFNQAYHTFGLLWTQTSVNAYVDGVLFETHASQSPGWIFNHPFYYILNLAIGGGPPGNPDSTTVFPQSLDVDYIRYYSPPTYTSPGAGTITDPCNDLSVVYNTSGNWIIDDSNPTYFNGDTGRMSRIYNATEFLNYKYPNISGATVTVGTGSANPTAVTLWYSTNNGSTYTAATNTYSAVTATTDGWGMYTVSTSGLPAGVTDLEIQEAPTANAWDHQIANVVITSGAPTVPAAPVALGAISGSNAVYLSWLGSNGGSTYNIYRSTTSGGEGTTPFATGNVGTTYGDLTVANNVTYYYKVAAVNSAGTSGQSGEMVANPTGTSTAPGAPSGLTATAGNAQVALTWTASSGATSYNVYRGTAAGGESTTAIATGITTASYTDTTVTNGTTYYYTVAAVSSGGTSTSSNEASATPSVPATPATPSGVAAAGGTAQITVTWAASSGATAYNVYRGTTSGGEGTTVYAALGNVTTYTNTGLGNGATYYYKVAAVNSVGTSAQSAEVSATTANTPAAPTGVTATAGNAQVALAWTASSGAASYNVYRGTTAGGESATALTTGLTGTTYTDSTVTNGTTYYYKVAAVNAVGTSAQSTEVSATPTAGTTEGPYGGAAAAIPGTVQAENYDTGGQGIGYSVASVNGSDNGYRSDGVDLEACTDTGGGVDVGWTAAGQWFRYTVNVATAGTYTAAFRVAADTATGTFHVQNAAGTNLSGSITAPVTGGWQTWATVNATVTLPAGQQVLTISQDSANFNINYVTFTLNSPPAAPTGVTATAGTAQIALAWSASSGATAYNVYRGTTAGGESATAIATGITTTSYTNTGLGNGATYYYKVAAVNSVGTSAQSAEVSATTANTPAAPTGVTATAGNAQATVTWTASSGATAYNVYRGTTSGSEGTTVYAALGNVTTYTNTGLTNGTTYYYKVAAVNAVGASAQSTEVSATPTAGTTEGPYGGAAAAIPGTIQAENYDTGGQGIGYSVASVNGSDNGYRSDGVDLEACTDTGGGVDVGWTAAGQWFRYTVNVATAGTYTAAFRVAADTATGTFHVQNAAGTNLSGSITAPVTGGWQTWATVNATVVLPAGQQVLTISQDSGNYNINYVTFTQNSPPAAPTGVTATGGNAQVALTWSASSGATSYNVYRGTTAGGELATAIATGVTTTSYTNTGLTNGTAYYYKVAAVSSVGTSAQSTEVSATPSAGTSGTTGSASIDCGGAASSPFVADADFSGGTTGSTTSAIVTTLLSNPPPAQAVLQTYRQGVMTYTMGGFTAGSAHVVSLYFVEPTYTAAGQRTFNVALNGTTVLSAFDIYGNTNAQFKGIQENFNATASASGQIVIAFTAVTSNPIIQAIVCN